MTINNASPEDWPSTWTCVECEREFAFKPSSEAPYAVASETGPHGQRVARGYICRACYETLEDQANET